MLLLDAAVVNVALPLMRVDLGFSPANLSWVLNAYALASAACCCSAAGSATSSDACVPSRWLALRVASLLGGLAQDPGCSSPHGRCKESAPRSPLPASWR